MAQEYNYFKAGENGINRFRATAYKLFNIENNELDLNRLNQEYNEGNIAYKLTSDFNLFFYVIMLSPIAIPLELSDKIKKKRNLEKKLNENA